MKADKSSHYRFVSVEDIVGFFLFQYSTLDETPDNFIDCCHWYFRKCMDVQRGMEFTLARNQQIRDASCSATKEMLERSVPVILDPMDHELTVGETSVILSGSLVIVCPSVV